MFNHLKQSEAIIIVLKLVKVKVAKVLQEDYQNFLNSKSS